MSEQDFEFAYAHGPHTEAPPVPGRIEENTSRGRPPVAWRCDVCGYRMLAMDHHGVPLPLERGPRGEVLPVFCRPYS